ncbi:MAG: hypothetical protein ACXWD5_13765 [Mycobacterium sp.]
MMLRSTLQAVALVTALQAVTASSALTQATIEIAIGDGPFEGFNDLTRGAARRAVLRAAADVWQGALRSPVPIRVHATMDPLTPCTSVSGLLGLGGAEQVFSGFPGAPRNNTWYPSALADYLAASDQDPNSHDINLTINSNLNTPNCLDNKDWWYGIGAAPDGTISLFNVVLHEIAHGLGFSTYVKVASGEKFFGKDDIYMTS